MPATWQITVYQTGSGPVPSEVMITEMPKTAVTRMQEIRAAHRRATLPLHASSTVSEDEAVTVCRMAAAAGLTLKRERCRRGE